LPSGRRDKSAPRIRRATAPTCIAGSGPAGLARWRKRARPACSWPAMGRASSPA
jgi:hypothetical protein